mmetsp:Transcript_19380/g.44151  ORF Transcript_19380/g.44151 Transcript_19380/m.44151 type:complete len:119 (+) Transcript_19380:304-660(+)
MKRSMPQKNRNKLCTLLGNIGRSWFAIDRQELLGFMNDIIIIRNGAVGWRTVGSPVFDDLAPVSVRSWEKATDGSIRSVRHEETYSSIVPPAAPSALPSQTLTHGVRGKARLAGQTIS